MSAIAGIARRTRDRRTEGAGRWLFPVPGLMPGAPESAPDPMPPDHEAVAAGYGYGQARPRPVALLLVVLLHALALAALLTHRMVLAPPAQPEPMLVVAVPPPVAPPPPAASAPDVRLDVPEIVVPPPIIEIAREAPPTVTARLAEPAPVAAAVQRQAADAPSSTPAVGPSLQSLPATMLEARPPRYPTESRRLKEQGTVVLDVLLSADGRVERIAVYQSSGSSRLDRAALEAVRRWRWSPMLRDGLAVGVRGLVEIPFVLTRR